MSFVGQQISHQYRIFPNLGGPLKEKNNSQKEGKKVRKKSKETIELIEEMEKIAYDLIRTDNKLCLRRVKKKKKALGKDEFLEKIAELEEDKMPAHCLKNIVFQDSVKKQGVIMIIEESILDRNKIWLKIFYRAA